MAAAIRMSSVSLSIWTMCHRTTDARSQACFAALMCAVDGWGRISGLTNDLFDEDGSVIVTFSSVEKAQYFRRCVHHYFDESILAALKVKSRVRKA
ncbi:hypothetical protein [Burkholderia gladioli]|uniref:hypothetical protein n=1 Tax=Burkholderia gladioli TaxID=28095 RepID=UPI00163EF455|nr:hypothetical protein [Burkholderia gladioli]